MPLENAIADPILSISFKSLMDCTRLSPNRYCVISCELLQSADKLWCKRGRIACLRCRDKSWVVWPRAAMASLFLLTAFWICACVSWLAACCVCSNISVLSASAMPTLAKGLLDQRHLDICFLHVRGHRLPNFHVDQGHLKVVTIFWLDILVKPFVKLTLCEFSPEGFVNDVCQ